MEQQPAGQILHLKNSPDTPLSERQIVEATIAFANGAQLQIEGLVARGPTETIGDAQIEHQLAEARAARQAGRPRDGAFLGAQIPQDLIVPSVEEHRRNLRAWVQQFIRLIRRHPHQAAAEIIRRDMVFLVEQKPVVRQGPQGLQLGSYYAFSTYADLVNLGVMLLADVDRAFNNKLCECQLEGCGAFFFEKKPETGRPQRKYCTQTHMLEAHTRNAAVRMAERRRQSAG